jgi:hypothetical protein
MAMIHFVLPILAFILLAYLCLLVLAVVVAAYPLVGMHFTLWKRWKMMEKAECQKAQQDRKIATPKRQSFAFWLGHGCTKLIHAYRALPRDTRNYR